MKTLLKKKHINRIGLRIAISLIISVSIIACAQTEDTQKPVSIHPFYPYAEQDSLRKEAGIKDSTFSKYYILYNLRTEDTAQLKKILQPYADSVVEINPVSKELVLIFYKKDKAFDSTYRETRTNPLFYHEKNRIANFYYTRRANDIYWEFFKNGEIIGAPDVKIENIPEKDSAIQLK